MAQLIISRILFRTEDCFKMERRVLNQRDKFQLRASLFDSCSHIDLSILRPLSVDQIAHSNVASRFGRQQSR